MWNTFDSRTQLVSVSAIIKGRFLYFMIFQLISGDLRMDLFDQVYIYIMNERD